jgi:hypothetical protein
MLADYSFFYELDGVTGRRKSVPALAQSEPNPKAIRGRRSIDERPIRQTLRLRSVRPTMAHAWSRRTSERGRANATATTLVRRFCATLLIDDEPIASGRGVDEVSAYAALVEALSLKGIVDGSVLGMQGLMRR